MFGWKNWKQNKLLDELAKLLATEVFNSIGKEVSVHPDEKDVDLIVDKWFVEVEYCRWWCEGEYFSPLYGKLSIPIRKVKNSLRRVENTWYMQFRGDCRWWIMCHSKDILNAYKNNQIGDHKGEKFVYVDLKLCTQGRVPNWTEEIEKLIEHCKKVKDKKTNEFLIKCRNI